MGGNANLRYYPGGSRSVALPHNHGRRHARARDWTPVVGKFATMNERRDAAPSGGEESETARGRAQPTRALDKSERRRAARTFIARPRNCQLERRHVRGGTVNRDSWVTVRPARDKFHRVTGATSSKVTSCPDTGLINLLLRSFHFLAIRTLSGDKSRRAGSFVEVAWRFQQ